MTLEDMRMLLRALDALCEVDRQAGCSDRFFRQVYTARVTALEASGIPRRLAEAISARETEGEKDEQ